MAHDTPDTGEVTTRGEDAGLPTGETEQGSSLTPTDASTDPVEAARATRAIDSDPALSPVAEQPGAASISGLPNRRERDWKI